MCAKTHSTSGVPSHSTVPWSSFQGGALVRGTCATTQTPRSALAQLYTSALFRDFTPVRRAAIITGRPSPAQDDLLVGTRGQMAPLSWPVQWGDTRCTRDPNGVQVKKSWQETGRDTYMLFPFNLLVGHLHCIQILKMQFHQPVNLKERYFRGMSEKGREYQGRRTAELLFISLSLPTKGEPLYRFSLWIRALL